MLKKLLSLLFAAVPLISAQAQNTYPWPSTGNIGIGTTNPLTPLDVKLAANQHVQFVAGVNGAYNGIPGIVSINDANSAYTPLGFYSSAYYFGYGNVGIGTTNPLYKLDVSGESNISGALHVGASSVNTNSTKLFIKNDYGKIWALSSGANNLTEQGFFIYNWSDNATTPYLSITNGGYMGIGTISPDSKLTVNGGIHSKSVVVDMNISADYVFKPTYKLPTLSFVASYIKKNQHLPEIPSEKEIVDKGMNVGEMNRLLLQKVEELTLYLLAKDKAIATLQKNNKVLDRRIAKLEKRYKNSSN